MEMTELTDNSTENRSKEKQTLVNKKKDTRWRHTLKGLCLALSQLVMVAASSTSVPLLERKIPDFELNVMRNGITFVVICLLLMAMRISPDVDNSKFWGLAAVCVVSSVHNTLFYVVVTLIPLSYFKSIYMTACQVFGIALYRIFLKEKAESRKVFFILVCICGIVLSIQPEYIFTWKKHRTEFLKTSSNITSAPTDHYNVTPAMTTLGCLLATVMGITGCLNVITTKQTVANFHHFLVIPFWCSFSGTVFSLFFMVIFEKPVLPTTWNQVLLIAIHSFSFVFIYILFTLTTKYISGNTYSILLSTLVILMLIPQYTLLKHILPGNRNWIEVLGTVLVFIGATTSSILEVVNPDKNLDIRSSEL